MLDTNTARCIRFMIHGMLCLELISCRSGGKVQPSCFWSRLFWRTEMFQSLCLNETKPLWCERRHFDSASHARSRGCDVLLKARAWWCNSRGWDRLPCFLLSPRGQKRVCSGPAALVENTTLLCITKEFDEEREMLKLRKKETHGECLAWPDCSLVDLLGTIRRCSLQQSQSNVFDSREGTTSPLFLLTYDTAACRLSSCQSFSFLMYLTVCCLHLRGFTAWLFRTTVAAFQTSILCIGVSVSLYFTVLFLVYILCTY